MEQLRQILSQMALNLELNIAMCDKIEDHENRLKALESHVKAHDVKLSGLSTRTAELLYSVADKKYAERHGKKDG